MNAFPHISSLTFEHQIYFHKFRRHTFRLSTHSAFSINSIKHFINFLFVRRHFVCIDIKYSFATDFTFFSNLFSFLRVINKYDSVYLSSSLLPLSQFHYLFKCHHVLGRFGYQFRNFGGEHRPQSTQGLDSEINN